MSVSSHKKEGIPQATSSLSKGARLKQGNKQLGNSLGVSQTEVR